MVRIRRYRSSDTESVVRLIRRGFRRFVLPGAASPAGAEYWLRFWSTKKSNLAEKAAWFAQTPIFFVAVEDANVVGLAMGTEARLINMFVRERYHGKGIGRRLMEQFEQECLRRGSTCLRLESSLHAVDFYLKMGCKRTTGIRNFKGLRVQHMKKALPPSGPRLNGGRTTG